MRRELVAVSMLFVAAVDCLNVDCQAFNPMICQTDAIPFCLSNGTQVIGSCHAKRAQCIDGIMVDDTFDACKKAVTTFDCAQFNPMVCSKDAISYCLSNGTMLTGTCAAKRAVCLESRKVDDTFGACNTMGGDTGNRVGDRGDSGNMDGGSGGSSGLAASIALLVASSLLLFPSLLH